MNTKPYLGLLAHNGPFAPWIFDLAFDIPAYSKKNNVYICGFQLKGSCNDKKQNSIIEFNTNISGIFKVIEKIEDKVLEEKVIKIQAPSLLLPYLRSTITSYFANAGYGPIIFPLINVHKMAEEAMADFQIKIID